jgi:hypothetical protein
MDEEDLEEIVHVLLDMMPNEISNKDLSIVVINFVIQKKWKIGGRLLVWQSIRF